MRLNLFFAIIVTLPVNSFFLNSCSDLSRLTWTERQEIAVNSFQIGLKSKSDGNDEKALRFFKKAIEADSTFVNAYSEIGEILIVRGEYRNAESVLSQIPIKIEPSAEIYYLLGSAQFHRKKINEAVINLEKAIQIVPDHRMASWMLAQLYFQIENYKQASEYLEKLLKDSLSTDNDKILAFSQRVDAILHVHNPKRSYENEELKALNQSTTVTRGQFAIAMVVELSPNASKADIRFTDVADDDLLLDYYKGAVNSGILETLPDGKFYPEYVMTRRNAAYYLQRFLRQKNIHIYQSEKPIIPSDVVKSDLQIDAIKNICRLGIMTTTGNGHFRPDEAISGKELIESITTIKKLFEPR